MARPVGGRPKHRTWKIPETTKKATPLFGRGLILNLDQLVKFYSSVCSSSSGSLNSVIPAETNILYQAKTFLMSET